LPSEVTRIFDETIKRFSGIEVAVNTTGMVIKKPIQIAREVAASIGAVQRELETSQK
jgi:hypothetical protein